jgi:hypothetical protein
VSAQLSCLWACGHNYPDAARWRSWKACAECHASRACQSSELLSGAMAEHLASIFGTGTWLCVADSLSTRAACGRFTLTRSYPTTALHYRERPRELPVLLQDGRLQVRRPCQRPGASAQTSEIRRAERQEKNPMEAASAVHCQRLTDFVAPRTRAGTATGALASTTSRRLARRCCCRICTTTRRTKLRPQVLR